MRFIKLLLLIVICFYGFALFVIQTINIPNRIWILILVAGLLLFDALRNGKIILAKVGSWLLIAMVFAYWGWYVHPDQIYMRALNSYLDMQEEVENLSSKLPLNFTAGECVDYTWWGDCTEIIPSTYTLEEIQKYLPRASQELRARELEYKAAKIRYNGDPEFYRSTFETWSFWALALIAITQAVLIIVDAKRINSVP